MSDMRHIVAQLEGKLLTVASGLQHDRAVPVATEDEVMLRG